MTQNTEKELKLKTKCEKDFPDFVHSQEGLSVEALEKNLLRYAKYREETLMAQSKDDALTQAKEVAKELNKPYLETLSALKVKMAYLHILLQEKAQNEEAQENQTAL